jgi:hypothetical protein
MTNILMFGAFGFVILNLFRISDFVIRIYDFLLNIPVLSQLLIDRIRKVTF